MLLTQPLGSTFMPWCCRVPDSRNHTVVYDPSGVRGLGSDYLHPLVNGVWSQTQYNLQLSLKLRPREERKNGKEQDIQSRKKEQG